MSHGDDYDHDDSYDNEDEIAFQEDEVISQADLDRLIEYARREQQSLRNTASRRTHDFIRWLRQEIEYIADTSRVHWRDILDIILEQIGMTWPDDSDDDS